MYLGSDTQKLRHFSEMMFTLAVTEILKKYFVKEILFQFI